MNNDLSAISRLLASPFKIPWPYTWRAALGIIFALFSLFDISNLTLDTRLNLAPKKNFSSHIQVIRINPSDTLKVQRNRGLQVSPSLFFEASDEFYWEEKLWSELLAKILAMKPHKIGVTLFFGNIAIDPKNLKLMQDPRIIWATPKVHELSTPPTLANNDRTNIAEFILSEDSDGKLRRIPMINTQYHFFSRLSARSNSGSLLRFDIHEKDLPYIDAQQILNNEVDPSQIEGKIILLGRAPSELSQPYLTPVGYYSKLGISALVLNNFYENTWIQVLPFSLYLIYVLIVSILTVLLIIRYPHKVALFFLVFLGLALTLLSISLFDLYGIWTPIAAVWVQILTTWILFLGYSLNRMEKQTLRLKEEKRLHQQLEELKINFVSLISHDLKTPIAKIQAVINQSFNRSLDEETTQEFNKINKYSRDLNRYIQNVLKLLQVETSQFKIEIDAVDINSLIEQVQRELKTLAKEKNLNFELDLSPLFLIEGDNQLLYEVLLNLVQNAIQYSNINGLIKISSAEENDYIIVRIQDQGLGVPADEIPFVFEKFYRGKTSSMIQQGSGLGLFLVKYFIELHHGRIQMNSQLHQGTTMTLWLPIEQKT